MSVRYIDLKDHYESLAGSMTIRPERKAEVDAVVDRILFNRGRYEGVERTTGVPWEVVASIHSLETSLSFHGHLHNGDPLSARTVHVPSGRPETGSPPFGWEESARDALLSEVTDEVSEWSLPECLWFLERYNGFGYLTGRGQGTTPRRRSPYLWSFTNHYLKGKYVGDGVFDPNAVSGQVGAAAILTRLREEVSNDASGGEGGNVEAPPLDRLLLQGTRGEDVARLQMRLRDRGHSPGEIDGQFGPLTLAAVLAFQRAVGIVQDGIVGPVTWGKLWEEGGEGAGSGQGGETGGQGASGTGSQAPGIRERILDVAAREAAKGRRHAPGNEIDRLVLDPLRPVMVQLGHLRSSHTDTFYNWCAAWVTYICREGGIDVPDRFDSFWASVALVDAWRHMGRQTGAWFRRGTRTPHPGDIVTFNWDGDRDLDHIGILQTFGPNITIVTFEGNRGNREGAFSRTLTQVDGFLDVEHLASQLGSRTA